jgi:hypothetical protein
MVSWWSDIRFMADRRPECDRHGHELAGASPVITPERREYVGKSKGARRTFIDLPEEG